MQQPELGKRLSELRKEKKLTQEELVEKSNVSVRTIQRIENGEVVPRIYTVKILLEALGESYESFSAVPTTQKETATSKLSNVKINTVMVGAVAGSVYLVTEIILGAMDISSITEYRHWSFMTHAIYIGLTAVMVFSFVLFARGFIALSIVFENPLLKVAAWLLVMATFGKGILDIYSLSVEDIRLLLIPYAGVSLIFGAISISFGISLIRLQDGMGELARIAGILEIVMGCMLVTVILFFITYVIMIPATVIEIVILFRGYEYLSRSDASA